MSQPHHIPLSEWRTVNGWRLQESENCARRDRRRNLCIAAAIVLLLVIAPFLAGCASRPYPVTYRQPWPLIFTVPATGSMRPAFNDGDTAVIVAGRWEDVKVGYKTGSVVVRGNVPWSPIGNRIFHRAVRRTHGGIVTQGDNCLYEDPGYMVEQDFGGFVLLVKRNEHPQPHHAQFYERI